MPGSKHEDGTQSDSEHALGEQRRAAALEERSWGLWGSAGIKEGRANVPEGLFAEEDSPARRCKSSTSKRQSGLVERRRGSAPHQHSARDECYGHRDEYSERGTYTIELENGTHEEEEARKLIDKVEVRQLFLYCFLHINPKIIVLFFSLYLSFRYLVWMINVFRVGGESIKEKGCLPRGLIRETEESQDVLRQRCKSIFLTYSGSPRLNLALAVREYSSFFFL